MENIDYKSRKAKSAALVMVNLRNVEGYQSVEDMIKADYGKGPNWGNRVTSLRVSIPKLEDTKILNPLEFIWRVHNTINRKRQSLAVCFSGWLLQMKHKLLGHEAAAKQLHSTLRKSSLAVSNMAGPLEQMALANHPVKGFYFTVTGIPQGLMITMMSYMGALRVTMITEEGFIHEQQLSSRINHAFQIILKAAKDFSFQQQQS